MADEKTATQSDEKSESRRQIESGNAKKDAKAATKKPPAKKAQKTPKKAAAKKGLRKGLQQSDYRARQERRAVPREPRAAASRSAATGLQEVVDDAVKRGRMTRGDAEKMLSELVKKGRARPTR